jgi:plastocyanin
LWRLALDRERVKELFVGRYRKQPKKGVPLKRLLYLAILSMVVLVVFAPAASAQDDMTVSIQDFFFSPDQMTVAPGTTVTWVNDGQQPHTSTADDGTWDSGTLQPGDDYSFTFDQPGTYTYHCSIHPDMTATITVSGDGGGTTPSASASMSPSASASMSPMASASASASASAPAKLAETGGISLPILAAAALLGLGALAVIAMWRGRASS